MKLKPSSGWTLVETVEENTGPIVTTTNPVKKTVVIGKNEFDDGVTSWKVGNTIAVRGSLQATLIENQFLVDNYF